MQEPSNLVAEFDRNFCFADALLDASGAGGHVVPNLHLYEFANSGIAPWYIARNRAISVKYFLNEWEYGLIGNLVVCIESAGEEYLAYLIAIADANMNELAAKEIIKFDASLGSKSSSVTWQMLLEISRKHLVEHRSILP